MANEIYRCRMINNINQAIKESQDAALLSHPVLIGRVREILASKLITPMLPLGFEVGTGKIVDNKGNQSDEIDIVIYNRAVLPPVMWSERDGVFPVESAYYAIEVKSQITATRLLDAVRKARSVIGLNVHWNEKEAFPNRAPTVNILFAFSSDLSDSSSELERYARIDPTWHSDPVLKAICVVGRGYWYHRPGYAKWTFLSPSNDHDEVIDIVSGIVNTLVKTPPYNRIAPLGPYISMDRAIVQI